VAIGCLLALGSAPGAQARTFHTVLQDDGLSLFAPGWLPQFMSKLRSLGVDELRISAEWKLEAPAPDSPAPPRGFRFSDPAAYRSSGMDLVDRAVRAAARAGLGVMIDPAFSAPLWATSARSQGAGRPGSLYRTNIDVGQLVAWETMLARRYNGTFTPPGQHTPLPRAGAFTLWNEPNGITFLKPQWRNGVPASADWTRAVTARAYPAIKRASPSATVLIGNTSNGGFNVPTRGGSVSALAFIERLACVDSALRPIHDGACAGFRTVPADGFAHHPYERDAAPWVPSGSGQDGWLQMGDLPKLQSLLDQLVAMHRFAPGAAKLWLTEQGYESNAELRDRPWTEAEQASLNAVSEYLAWRDPQIMSFSQFLLRDTLTYETLALRAASRRPKAQRVGTWTTGLVRQDMRPKPSLAMFRSPVVVRELASAGGSSLLEVWGRARPARSPVPVQIQVLLHGHFTTIGNAVTDANGIFDTELAAPGVTGRSVSVRFQWLPAGGTWQTSPPSGPLSIPGAS
jgi:hypothetical protein